MAQTEFLTLQSDFDVREKGRDLTQSIDKSHFTHKKIQKAM